jgi:D-psicose/D-tagatose/L-ribulose 3-epimerase
MQLGVTTYLWAAEFTTAQLALLPRIREAGFDGVELPVFRPAGFPVDDVRAGLDRHQLACTVALALVPGFSLISADRAVRRRTVQHLRDIIDVAGSLGAACIAGPVYHPVGDLPGRRRTDQEWHRAVEGYQAISPALAASHVTLAIEPLNRFETSFLNTTADAGALVDAVAHPNVGVLFDTFHTNIEEKDAAASCRALGRRVAHVHTSENDRGTPGSGHVAWTSILAALQAIGYDRWLTIEGFGFSLGDLSAAASIWRDIERTPDAIAWDGLAFLKSSLQAAGPSGGR